MLRLGPRWGANREGKGEKEGEWNLGGIWEGKRRGRTDRARDGKGMEGGKGKEEKGRGGEGEGRRWNGI